MVGGEWQTHSNRRARPIGSLSAWCDLNLPSAKSAKIATLVAKKEATEGVVAILKKFQKRGAELSKVQRGILETELDGAGDWSAAATRPESSQTGSKCWRSSWLRPNSRAPAGHLCNAGDPEAEGERGASGPEVEDKVDADGPQADVERKPRPPQRTSTQA